MNVLLLISLFLVLPACARELTLDAVEVQDVEITDRQTLDLCDCGPAGGDPDGLSCEAEGYVIAGFERHGMYSPEGGNLLCLELP